MGEPQDEISLRELYLIFRGGLRWIVGVSLAVAIIAFVVVHFRPESYQATATIRVAPLQVNGQTLQNGQVQNDIVDVNSVTQIGYDAYHTIAMSQAVLTATLKSVPSVPSDLTPKRLAEIANVSKVSGGGSTPLIVSQTITWSDPQVAAELTNAWARASADAAQASIGTSLGNVRTTMTSQMSSLSDALAAAESSWAAFQKQDERSSLQAQLDALDTRTTTAQERLDELEREIATAKAQQAFLQAVVGARSTGSRADLAAQMQALSDQGVLDPTLAQQLTTAIASLPGNPGAANQDLATLVARAQLQQQAADLAGYVAERATLKEQLVGFAKQGTDLRTQLASQQQTAQQLQRQLDSAQQAYNQVAQVGPILNVADKLVPSMAGVFNAASVPEKPESRRTGVVTAVAFVLAFFVMVLGVFLRAAVAEDPHGAASAAPGAPEAGSPPHARGGPDGESLGDPAS